MLIQTFLNCSTQFLDAIFLLSSVLCPKCLVIYDDKVNSVQEAHLNDVHILRLSKSISFLQYFVNICTFLSISYL